MSQPLCPVCNSMLSVPEQAGGRCDRCEAKFPPIAPAPSAARLSQPLSVATAPRDADNPYQAPVQSFQAALAGMEQPAASPEQAKAGSEAMQLLYAIAVLQLIFCIVLLAAPNVLGQPIPAEGVLLFGLPVVALFGALGTWSLWQPLPATIAGLAAYVFCIGLDFMADPLLASRGIIVKVFIIGGLVKILFTLLKGR